MTFAQPSKQFRGNHTKLCKTPELFLYIIIVRKINFLIKSVLFPNKKFELDLPTVFFTSNNHIQLLTKSFYHQAHQRPDGHQKWAMFTGY
jgi:hypothetical protein